MKSKFLIGAVALIAIGVFGVALLGQSSSQSGVAAAAARPAPSARTASGALGSGSGGSSTKSYTLSEVARHASASSCWTAINGKVYDVTDWINQHPGGPERILNLCGTDGSAAFDNQHGGQSRPAQELASFYIGDLSS